MERFCLVLIFVIPCVLSHTLMTNVTINGVTRTDCLRMVYDDNYGYTHNTGIYSSFPLMDNSARINGILSDNYTCGFLPFAAEPAANKCVIAAGSTISFSYWHGAITGEDPVLDRFIARSHRGPIMVHMAKSETGAGNVWFKTFEEGITSFSTDYTQTKWSSPDTLLANNGMMTVTIPRDLSPGNYLFRTELIALHSAGATSGAQPYVRCVELTVTGSGTANPPGVAIPGPEYANLTSPGILYNLYTSNPVGGANYPFPGKAVYQAGSTPVSPSTTHAKSTPATSSTAARVSTTESQADYASASEQSSPDSPSYAMQSSSICFALLAFVLAML